jgi:phosphohistidine phosphatase
MKTLCLLRHAKSSWKYPELEDFERPLNRRGRKDAPLMGKILKDRLKFNFDLIVSSPASRATVTTRIIADVLHQPGDQISFSNLLYAASTQGDQISFSNLLYATSTQTLITFIKNIEDRVERLLLVGHNPELTSLANILTDYHVSNIPTCGLFGMELKISSWSKISEKCGKFLFFEYPKKYYDDQEE